MHRITRLVAYRYPFLPLRRRLPFLDGSKEEIPDGLIVKTRSGVLVKVTHDGMYHDVYFWGDYEPFHTKLYRMLVSAGDTVFDIGANFGWFTTLFSRWVGEEGRVHAFEPVPFIHDLAVETLRLNALASNVRLNTMALGRQRGTLTMRTYSGLPHGHATAVDLDRDDATEHTCVLSTLDNYCREHAVGSIQFLKADVEGFEVDVFAGGHELLSTDHAPIVAFEINGDCLRPRSLQSQDVISSLRDLGYTDFYRFSIRMGMQPVTNESFERGDCIAGKPFHRRKLARARRVSRITR